MVASIYTVIDHYHRITTTLEREHKELDQETDHIQDTDDGYFSLTSPKYNELMTRLAGVNLRTVELCRQIRATCQTANLVMEFMFGYRGSWNKQADSSFTKL